MRTVSLGQVIVLILICVLLFGDLAKFKKHFKIFLKHIKNFFV